MSSDLKTRLAVAQMVVADGIGQHMVLPCMSKVSLDVKKNEEENTLEFSVLVAGKTYGKNFASMVTSHLNAYMDKLMEYLAKAFKEIGHEIPSCRLQFHMDEAILLEQGLAKKRVLTLTLA